jgi:hypothetical protein
VTRAAITGLAAAALACAAPASSRAENGWEAKWLGQSEYPTLESGETVTSFLDVQNVGSKAWTPANTLLGTSNPRDRNSAFFVPGTWRNAIRLVPIDRAVPPQGTGRFTFPMHAPDVASTTAIREYLEPVADDPADSGWMGSPTNWNGVFLEYTVLPAQNPTIQLNSAPLSVDRGQPIELSATAGDNRSVSRVLLSVRGRDGVVEAAKGSGSSYAGKVDSSALAPGIYTLAARAEDPAGHASEATAQVTVREPERGRAPGPADGPPAWPVRLRAGWTYRGRSTRVRTLTVSRLSADATVALRCAGRGCRFTSRQVRTGGRSSVRLASRFRGRSLHAGARIVLTLARPGQGARSFTFRMRAGRLPTARESCRAPNGRAVGCER